MDLLNVLWSFDTNLSEACTDAYVSKNEWARLRTEPDNQNAFKASLPSVSTRAQGSQERNARGNLHVEAQIQCDVQRRKVLLCKSGRSIEEGGPFTDSVAKRRTWQAKRRRKEELSDSALKG